MHRHRKELFELVVDWRADGRCTGKRRNIVWRSGGGGRGKSSDGVGSERASRECAHGVRRADNWLFPGAHKLRSRTPFSVLAHIIPPANSLILHLPSSQTKLMTLIETAGPPDGMCGIGIPIYALLCTPYTSTRAHIWALLHRAIVLPPTPL